MEQYSAKFQAKEVFKYCPQCGSESFKFQGQKSFLCHHCDFLYYINVAGAVAALILDSKNQLLFVRRALDPHKGTLDLPGGFIDMGESAEHALEREILEELKTEVNQYEFYKSYPNQYTFRGYTYHTIDLFFKVFVEDFSVLEAGDDAAALVYKPVNEVTPDEIGLHSIRQVVMHFLTEIDKK